MNILQQNNNKKLFITFLIQALFLMPVFGIDLDYTVDDAIRKNYNVNQINNIGGNNSNKSVSQPTKTTPQPVQKATVSEPLPKLPALPKNASGSSSSNNSTIKSQPIKTYTQKPIKKTITKTNKKVLQLRKGMVFDISNVNSISDKQRVGTSIVFVSRKPIKTAYYTIPEGTKFVGEIVESHTPQLTGNGGLVNLSVCSIIFGGTYQHIDTRVIRVGGKKVFFEDIKGKRSYWKNTVNKGKWGRNTFHKMNKLSANLVQDKTTVILAPFTFVYGLTLGTISTVASPVVSIFCKGGSVYIPANTPFRIKFEQDVKLYY